MKTAKTLALRSTGVFAIFAMFALLSWLPDVVYLHYGSRAAYHRLARAVYDGDLREVKAELRNGVSPNLPIDTHPDPSSEDDDPPLCVAIDHGHWDIAYALLDAGADPNSYDPWTESNCYDGRYARAANISKGRTGKRSH